MCTLRNGFMVFVPLIYDVYIYFHHSLLPIFEVLTGDGIKAKSYALIYAGLTFLHLADLHLEQTAYPADRDVFSHLIA